MTVAWDAMSDSEVFESLKQAPRKVAGPWIEPIDYAGRVINSACRRTPDNQTIVWEEPDGAGYVIHAWATTEGYGGQCLRFATRAAVDAWLRDHGWRLAEAVN
jgi:hypothetical protein